MSAPLVTVVGLGPAGEDLLTAGTVAEIEAHRIRFLRTARHPSAAAIGDAETFDEFYERFDTFEQVYHAIVERLVQAAVEHGDVLYAVPGSPSVAEHSVELLLADPRVRVAVIPALSFADLAWSRLGVDPLSSGVRIIDGHRFSEQTGGSSGPFLVAQCDQPWVASDIKLSRDDCDDVDVKVIQRLGLPDEEILTVRWNELDRIATDHLTSLYIEGLPPSTGEAFARFEQMVSRLRVECPWDAEQTHASLRRYLLEEAYETIDAIDAVVTADSAVVIADSAVAPIGYRDDAADTDPDDHLAEELGDLLYQVFFHAAIASERGGFGAADVATGVHDKLYAHHPHVFGADQAISAEEVAANWEAIKQAEKGRSSVMDGIPETLPALLYALKVHKKANAVGRPFAASAPAVRDVVADAVDALEDPTDSGTWADVLFSIVGLMGERGLDPEMALRDATRRRLDEWHRSTE